MLRSYKSAKYASLLQVSKTEDAMHPARDGQQTSREQTAVNSTMHSLQCHQSSAARLHQAAHLLLPAAVGALHQLPAVQQPAALGQPVRPPPTQT